MDPRIVTRTSPRQYPKRVLLSLAALLGLSVMVTGVNARQAQEPMAYIQAANLHLSGDSGMDLPGGATLKSAVNDVWVTIHARELDANAAYTLWAIVFNQPDACTTAPDSPTRCGSSDLTATPNSAEASAFVVGGFVTGEDGTANVNAHLRGGPLPEGTDVLWGTGGRNDNGSEPGLRTDNGLVAEIHFVLRTHGPILVGGTAEQISTLNGGCPPNACSNQQAVVFPPVMK